MIPKSVSTQKCCLSAQPNMSDLDLFVSSFADTFESDISYAQVYKNFDDTSLYDTWIFDGNVDTEIVGTKKFMSYPYNEVQFKVGDYIHWQGDVWLMMSLDTTRYYNVCGEVTPCNQVFKWYNKSGILIEKPCVVEHRESGDIPTDLDIGTLTGMRHVFMPLDDDTKQINYYTIKDNILFVIPNEKQVYRLSGVNASESNTLVRFDLELYSIDEDRVDWENGVVLPNEVLVEPSEPSTPTTGEGYEVVMTPSVTEMQLNDYKILTFSLLSDGDQVFDNFVISVSDASTVLDGGYIFSDNGDNTCVVSNASGGGTLTLSVVGSLASETFDIEMTQLMGV